MTDYDAVVIGGGQAGLAAAYALRARGHTPVILEAGAAGRPDQRRMFTAVDGGDVVWSDGQRESVDTIILATGFRPGLSYLHDLGALDDHGAPHHNRGLSTVHKGLGYVGLEWQRSFASATLRGVGRDAEYVIRQLTGTRAPSQARCCQPVG